MKSKRIKNRNELLKHPVDYATRYPEAMPLRTTNAMTVAETLIQYFFRVGILDEKVSDQESSFISKLIAQL